MQAAGTPSDPSPKGTDAAAGAPRTPETSVAAGPSSSVYARLGAAAQPAERYRLEGEIARGGMGAILKVWDESLRRTLAMKVALTRGTPSTSDKQTLAADSRLLDRFLEEAQITGQLDHPGVVPVHELGLDAEGRAYFTMRLVKGSDLKEVFEHARSGAQGWSRTRALTVVLKVCEAMAFAHEKGVIHRDLKPANVMVGRFGETYVMDWGLARVLGQEDSRDLRLKDSSVSLVQTNRAEERASDSPLVTMDGDVVGTPCYMSPEQARGKLEDLGPRSDVYSVGAMLYHLLTGRMPYVPEGQLGSPQAVLTALLEGPPEAIHAIDRRVPDELVAICEKAMQREPSARYATMLEMAEDLRAYLEDRVVTAHESGPLAEFRKWIRRNRVAAGASAAAVLLAVAGLVTVVVLQARSNEHLQRANIEIQAARDEALAAQSALAGKNEELGHARDEADRTARAARRSEYAANIAAANAGLRLADAGDARRRLALCEEELRGWEWRHLALAAGPSLLALQLPGEATGLAAHPSRPEAAVGSSDGKIVVQSLLDATQRRTIAAEGCLTGMLCYDATGAQLICPSQDGVLRRWDSASGQELAGLGAQESAITALALSQDGRWAATGSTDKLIRVWDMRDGALRWTLEGHRSSISALAFDPDGRRLASGSRDRSLRLWDLELGQELRTLGETEYSIAFVAFSPDGGRVAAGTAAFADSTGAPLARGANSVSVWSTDGVLLGEFSGPANELTAGCFSPDGLGLLAASRDATLWLWDLRSGQARVLLGHVGEVADADFAPGGRPILSVSSKGELRAWDPDIDVGLGLTGHAGSVAGLAFALGGERVITASMDFTLRGWSTSTGLLETVFRGHTNAVHELAVDASGERLASASLDGSVRLWEVASGEQLWQLSVAKESGFAKSPLSSLMRIAFDPAGSWLAILTGSGTVELVDLESQAVVRSLPCAVGQPTALAVHPDGGRIVVVTEEGLRRESTVHVLDLVNGATLAERKSAHRVGALAFHPSGALLVAEGAQIFELAVDDLSVARLLQGHEQPVRGLAFTPDGTRLASGGEDDTVRLWDYETGMSLLSLPSSGGDVLDLQFDGSGRQLAAALGSWSAFLWCTTPSAEREAARRAELAERAAVLDLLDGLFERFADPEIVVERLRNDPGLESKKLRAAATLARLVATSSRSADREWWRSVRLPDQPREEVHLALWSALCAERQQPDEERSLRLLGAAHYRLGHLEQAAQALERSNALRANRSRFDILAFLAMTYHRLGREEEARKASQEMAALMQVPSVLLQPDNQLLRREAESAARAAAGGR